MAPEDKNTLSVAEFRERLDETRVHCAICGARDYALVKHLKTRHNMSPGQYKKKFPQSTLVSPVVSELIRRMDRESKQTDDLTKALEDFNFGTDFTGLFAEVNVKWGESSGEQKQYIPEEMSHYRLQEAPTRQLMIGLTLGRHVYIGGPTGCGKTELVFQAHHKAQRGVMRINMRGEITSDIFMGVTTVDPKLGTVFHKGALPICMIEGITLYVDEIDYTPPQMAAIMNPVLEMKNPTLYIEELGETIQAHPDFRIVGAGNTGGKGDQFGTFTGTEVLNTAFLDRFGVKISMDYLEYDEEVEMLRDQFGKRDGIEKLVKLANEIRTAFKQGDLSVTLSTRKLVDFFLMTPSFSTREAMDVILMNWLDDEDRALVQEIINRVDVVLTDYRGEIT